MRPRPQGIIILYTVLILGVSSMIAAGVLARGSLDGYLDSAEALTAQGTRAKVFGCIDEALIQLQKDNAFAPATVTIGTATCTLAVTTPFAGQRSVTATLTEETITRSVTATVTLSPFAVTQISEP